MPQRYVGRWSTYAAVLSRLLSCKYWWLTSIVMFTYPRRKQQNQCDILPILSLRWYLGCPDKVRYNNRYSRCGHVQHQPAAARACRGIPAIAGRPADRLDKMTAPSLPRVWGWLNCGDGKIVTNFHLAIGCNPQTCIIKRTEPPASSCRSLPSAFSFVSSVLIPHTSSIGLPLKA